MAWNANPLKRLPQIVAELGNKRLRARVELTEEQREVAVWLRGNYKAFNGLKDLITARIETRGLSPVPNESLVAHLDKARDNECLRLLKELETILKSPMPSLNEGDEEGI